ncbi:hypothetical protein LTR56_009447 [Elasticomyces elasticus]|nr:hypothetical protein LTR56_009447 [Elasticomyces elasticus]KAK3645879.1 hypothetical protein LTR22_014545 [Elasticomyces elasticus]KAK4931033.1 hypothetical protein LTR49_002448 [Elasticomyces elasticus]KAK5765500.1 hypothetical protein LTS12_004251 [Elasticomyces elasticus]
MPFRTTSSRTTRSMTARSLAVSESLRANTSNSSTESSRLLSLPPELRNRIYEYTLSFEIVLISQRRHPDSTAHAFTNLLALLKVNRQIYHEATNMFYFCNQFIIEAHVPMKPINDPTPGRPDVFLCEGPNPRSTMSALYEFLGRIGGTQGRGTVDIVFSLGELRDWSMRPCDHTASIMRRMLEDLRAIRAADARIQLDLSMKVCPVEFFNTERGYRQNHASQSITLSITEPMPAISAFVVELEEMAVGNRERGFPEGRELNAFRTFFIALKQSIEESPNWQQASEAISEGDRQEKA